MADQITTTPLVERLRAQAARHREHATGLASAALLEEAADEIELLRDAEERWVARLVAVRDALGRPDLKVDDIAGDVERVRGAALDAYGAAGRAQELNLSNYDEDNVSALNAVMVETWSILDKAFGPRTEG